MLDAYTITRPLMQMQNQPLWDARHFQGVTGGALRCDAAEALAARGLCRRCNLPTSHFLVPTCSCGVSRAEPLPIEHDL